MRRSGKDSYEHLDQAKSGDKNTRNEVDSTLQGEKNLGKIIGVYVENLEMNFAPYFGRAVLVLLVVMAVGFGGFGIVYLNSTSPPAMGGKLNVVVAEFYGPDRGNNQVSEQLTLRLKAELEEYDDVLIRSFGEAISEEEGSEQARKLGERLNVDLFLWGSYQGEDNSIVTLNIENLSDSPSLKMSDNPAIRPPVELADFQNAEYDIQWPNETEAYIKFLKGVIRYEAGDFERADEIFTAAIKSGSFPESDVRLAYFLRGTSYFHSYDYEKAVSDYDKALMIDSVNVETLNNRGVAYLYLGEMENAIADYDKVLQIDPEYANGYNGRGLAYFNLGEVDIAIADYNQALRLNPELVNVYHNRGLAYTYLGAYENAMEDYNVALQFDPSYSNIYLSRAFTFTKMGNKEEALNDLNRAIELGLDAESMSYAKTLLNQIEETGP